MKSVTQFSRSCAFVSRLWEKPCCWENPNDVYSTTSSSSIKGLNLFNEPKAIYIPTWYLSFYDWKIFGIRSDFISVGYDRMRSPTSANSLRISSETQADTLHGNHRRSLELNQASDEKKPSYERRKKNFHIFIYCFFYLRRNKWRWRDGWRWLGKVCVESFLERLLWISSCTHAAGLSTDWT